MLFRKLAWFTNDNARGDFSDTLYRYWLLRGLIIITFFPPCLFIIFYYKNIRFSYIEMFMIYILHVIYLLYLTRCKYLPHIKQPALFDGSSCSLVNIPRFFFFSFKNKLLQQMPLNVISTTF